MLAGTLSSLTASAQDIHFSQFYENAMLRNPGLTGIFSGDYKAVVNYRTQWGNVSAPFQTVLGSYEQRSILNHENGDALSYGVTVSYDKAGSIDFTTMQVYPSIAYNKSLEDAHNTFLSFGFAGGYIARSVDASKMTFDNQWINGNYSPGAASGETTQYSNTHHFDLGAGISLNSSLGSDNKVNYYLGVAAYHVSRPQESFDKTDYFTRLNTKWSGNLGLQWRINDQFSATIHANYTNQAPYQEWIMGGIISWRSFDPAAMASNFSIGLGLYARLNDALIPTARINYKNYSFIASYDVNNSSLQPAVNTSAGYEFSLVIKGKFPKKRDRMEQVNCPRFEEDTQAGFQEQR